jgi:4-hydroxy-2-oxoglutarate aldolase
MAGSGSYLHSAILAGGSGGVMALCNVYPRWCATLHRLASSNAPSAAKLQSLLVPVNQAVTRDFGIAGLKYAMEKVGVGFIGGSPRLPLLPLLEQQKQTMSKILSDFESQVNVLKL